MAMLTEDGAAGRVRADLYGVRLALILREIAAGSDLFVAHLVDSDEHDAHVGGLALRRGPRDLSPTRRCVRRR